MCQKIPIVSFKCISDIVTAHIHIITLTFLFSFNLFTCSVFFCKYTLTVCTFFFLVNLTLNQTSPSTDLFFPVTCFLPSHSRRLPCGPVPVPQAPSPPLTQSNPNLSGQQHHGSSEAGTLQCQSPAPRCLHSQGPALSEDSVNATTPGKVTGSAACSRIQAYM